MKMLAVALALLAPPPVTHDTLPVLVPPTGRAGSGSTSSGAGAAASGPRRPSDWESFGDREPSPISRLRSSSSTPGSPADIWIDRASSFLRVRPRLRLPRRGRQGLLHEASPRRRRLCRLARRRRLSPGGRTPRHVGIVGDEATGRRRRCRGPRASPTHREERVLRRTAGARRRADAHRRARARWCAHVYDVDRCTAATSPHSRHHSVHPADGYWNVRVLRVRR